MTNEGLVLCSCKLPPPSHTVLLEEVNELGMGTAGMDSGDCLNE
jgi:hypothetical protein